MLNKTPQSYNGSNRTSLTARLFSFASVAFFLIAGSAFAEVTIYPVPKGLTPMTRYRVEVSDGTDFKPVFVHRSVAQKRDSNSHSQVAWASFAFTGKVIVRVTKTDGPVPRTVVVIPSSRRIETTLTNRSVTFELAKPGQFSVEFDNDVRLPMLIFADPPETNIPNRHAPGVVWFEPGIHILTNGLLRVSAGQTVYLAPGALVYGRITGQGRNIRILGRGILSGEKVRWKSEKERLTLHLCVLEPGSGGAVVDGPTFINSPFYNLTIKGEHAQVRNVKMISWWFSTDGIGTWGKSLIEDCFLMCNDDALKLYHSATTVRRCTIWQLENGAPFQISWNMPGINTGFQISDCDVIRTEHRWKNDNNAVFCAIHGGEGHMSDYVFDDIRIENAPFRIWNVTIQTNEFALGLSPGTISKLTFRNIRIGEPTRMPNKLRGFSPTSTITDVLFENIILPGGKRLTIPQDAKIEWDAETVKNVVIR